MGQVPGKLTMCFRMTRCTGSDNVLVAQGGIRVTGRQDVVGTVAVIALGCSVGAQLADLAVIGVKKGRGKILVTVSALFHHRDPETLRVDPSDGVRCVAVLADGQSFRRHHILRPVDARPEFFLDPPVASATGLGKVFPADRTFRIRSRERPVRAMAVNTAGGHDESTFQQALAMGTVFVTSDDVRNLTLQPFRCHGPCCVAFTAQLRNIPGKRPRGRHSMRHRLVALVTGHTNRHVRISLSEQLTMGTQLIILNLGSMTDRTIDRLCNRSAGPFRVPRVDLRMTLRARRPSVSHHGEPFLIDEDRDRLTVTLHRQVLLGVAFEAVLIGCSPGLRRSTPNLVGLVTFNTRRNLVRFFFPQPAFDDFGMNLFNAAVALHAGRRDVIPIDAALRVVVIQNEMGGVT